MALKIKKGATIAPYGATGNTFTDETPLSQAVLAHLKTRFPDEIEGEDENAGKTVSYKRQTVEDLKAALTEREIAFDEKANKADLIALLEKADEETA